MKKWRGITRPAVFAAMTLFLLGGVLIAQADSIFTDDGSTEGLKGGETFDGIPVAIDADQTREEAEALAAQPPFQMPEEFLRLEVASQATIDYVITRASTYVDAPLATATTVAVVSADDAREFAAHVGIVSPPIEAASRDLTVVVMQIVGDGNFVKPRVRAGGSAELKGDTLVALVSGPGRVDTIVVTSWDNVAGLVSKASIAETFDALLTADV
mgnify:CR=1 FL=1